MFNPSGADPKRSFSAANRSAGGSGSGVRPWILGGFRNSTARRRAAIRGRGRTVVVVIAIIRPACSRFSFTPMPHLLRARDHRNQPIVAPGDGASTRLCYFNLLRLRAGESHPLSVPGCELLAVVLSGRADITVGAQTFSGVGRRAHIWDGLADSVYCGTGAPLAVPQ
jgi:KduI/IolB family